MGDLTRRRVWNRSARLAISLAFASLMASAAAQDRPTRGDAGAGPWVIGPNQDSIVLSMLGGERLIAGCRLEGADIPQDRIEATYHCEGSAVPVVVTLTHKPERGCTDNCSAKFAIAVPEGVPRAFLPALVRTVSAGEAGFTWSRRTERRPATPRKRWSWPSGLHVNGLVFGALLAFLLVRAFIRRDEPSTDPSSSGDAPVPATPAASEVDPAPPVEDDSSAST